jgi:dCTP deaminase
LIWYADLSKPSKLDVTTGYDNIPSHLTGPMAGGLQSFAGLLAKIGENDKALTERINTVEREQAVMKWATALAVGALITFSVKECSGQRSVSTPPAAVSGTTPPN